MGEVHRLATHTGERNGTEREAPRPAPQLDYRAMLFSLAHSPVSSGPGHNDWKDK